MGATRVFVLAFVLCIAVTMSGCAALDGADGGQPAATATPADTPQEGVTPSQTPPDESEEPPAPTPEQPAELSLNTSVVVADSGDPVQTGWLNLYDDDGEMVERRNLSNTPTPSFEGLRPGETYEIEAVNTSYPPASETVTLTESTEQTLAVGYEFQGTESFRFQYTIVRPHPNRNVTQVDVGVGEIAANGDAMLGEWQAVDASLDIDVSHGMALHTRLLFDVADREYQFDTPPTQWVSIDGETYRKERRTAGWSSGLDYEFDDPDLTTVREGAGRFDETERRYLRSAELSGPALPDARNGLAVDVYEITDVEWFYGESTIERLLIYVDPASGHVVRWDVERKLNDGRDFTLVADYYDHGESVEITAGEFGIDDA